MCCTPLDFARGDNSLSIYLGGRGAHLIIIIGEPRPPFF